MSGEVIGRSVQGRPITLARIGDPAAPRKVLAVGCIHGNEPAGRGIVADLMRASPAPDTQLLLVRDMNPDGFAHHQRTNAHGVDLNRNSPEHWAGAGARPWSEPETRAIRDLILRELPDAEPLLPPALRPRRRPRGRPSAGRAQVLGARRPAAASA